MAIKSIFTAVTNALQSEKLKMWHLIVGWAASSIVAALVSYWATQHTSYQAALADRSKELIESSAEFETKVRSVLVSGNSFAELDKDKYRQLADNIEAQISALNKLRPILDQNQKGLAVNYQSTLIDLRDVLDEGLKPENTRKFGTDAVLLTKQRDELLGSLS